MEKRRRDRGRASGGGRGGVEKWGVGEDGGRGSRETRLHPIQGTELK